MMRRHWIFAATVIVLAAAWCVWWYYALNRAELGALKLQQRFAARGTEIRCGDPRWSGFPFRLSLDCTPFTVAAMKSTDTRSLAFPHLRFTATAFRLNDVVAVSDSPAMWAWGQERSRILTNDAALASYRKGPPDELSILVRGLKVETGAGADYINLRLTNASDAKSGDIAFALEASGARLDVPLLSDTPLDRVVATGTLSMSDPSELLSPQTLSAMELEGAELELADFTLEQQGVRITGHGRLGLDETSRLDGKLALAVENVGGLLARLQKDGFITSSEASGGFVLLSLLGGKEGKVKLDLRAEHGEMYLGPLKLGRLGPLAGDG